MSNKHNRVASRPQTDNMLAIKQSLTRHSGPLPVAADFEHYERVLPGTAERIVSMAEKQVEHRHQFENKMLVDSVKLEHKGQNLAFLVTFLALLAIVACVVLGHPYASIAPTLVAVPGLVSAFVNKKK